MSYDDLTHLITDNTVMRLVKTLKEQSEYKDYADAFMGLIRYHDDVLRLLWLLKKIKHDIFIAVLNALGVLLILLFNLPHCIWLFVGVTLIALAVNYAQYHRLVQELNQLKEELEK